MAPLEIELLNEVGCLLGSDDAVLVIDVTSAPKGKHSVAGLNQRGDDGPVVRVTVGPRKQRVFATELDPTDRSFNGVMIEFDAAIVDEARQSLPTREGVTDGGASLLSWLMSACLA